VSCAPYLSANGQSDIYYVDINVNVEKDSVMSFGEVKSVPEINTLGRESFPFVSWDGALYFSSDGIHKNKEGILQLGLGLLDIYKVDDIDEVIKNSEKKIKQDVKIRHLESPFNSPKDDFAFFMEKPKDSLYAYFSSNRIHPNAKGSDDIYRATMELSSINKVKKFKTIQVYVTDSFSKKPLEDALIELMDADDNVLEKGQTDSTGIYNFEVESDKSFHLRSSLLMYDDDDKIFKTVEGVNSINLSMNPPCEYTVNHEWEKDSIVAESIVEEKLEPILKLLKANPEIKIRIESYTDSRGPDGYNEELSKRRAKASKAYLVKKGIVSDRIITKGYGEKCLLVSDEEILKLSTKEERDDAHLSNRRSLFIIEGCDINLKGCNE
jgi:hypothetical protein